MRESLAGRKRAREDGPELLQTCPVRGLIWSAEQRTFDEAVREAVAMQRQRALAQNVAKIVDNADDAANRDGLDIRDANEENTEC